jgi:hypothetical protein
VSPNTTPDQETIKDNQKRKVTSSRYPASSTTPNTHGRETPHDLP